MGLKQRAKQILLEKPSPRKISRGALFTMLQAALTPARMFSSRSQKKISIHGYNHARRFFRDSGKSVFTSIFSPTELLYAYNLFPFVLEFFGGIAAAFDIAPELLTETEKKWFSTDFCSFHRAFIGIAQHRLLPKPCFLLANSHACDGNLKSFSEVSRLYGRPLLFIQTPFNKSKESVSYIAQQLRCISEEIERILGRQLSIRNLDRAFSYSNRTSRALREIGEIRKSSTPLMWGEEAFGFIVPWTLLMGSRSGAIISESYRDELRRRKNSSFDQIWAKKRILWLHLKPYFKNKLIHILERELGAVIIAEEINCQSWPELDIDSPWESLAQKLLNQLWVGGVEGRINNIRRIIEEYKIDGVIHFSHWGCRQSNGCVRFIKDTVSEYGIPFLNLDGDLVDPRNYSEAQYRTRLEGFMEILEGK